MLLLVVLTWGKIVPSSRTSAVLRHANLEVDAFNEALDNVVIE